MTGSSKTICAAMALSLAACALAPAASAANGNNAAFFGGLAAGVVGSAIVNGAAAPAYGPGYGYGYQPSGIYAAPVYVPRRCWFVDTPVYGAYGQYLYTQHQRQCN